LGDLALDVFMGSGTTLLAAEKIGRRRTGLHLLACPMGPQ
jgi:DNA modification methylase